MVALLKEPAWGLLSHSQTVTVWQTDRQTELLQHIPHLDATYHVIKNGKTAQLLLTVRTVNGNHIGGKSSVEPVDNQFQQWRCIVYIYIVMSQSIQFCLVSVFVSTKLPAHAYHQLQHRHEVGTAHVGGYHGVTEALKNTLAMNTGSTVVVDSCVCSDNGTQRCHHLHHGIQQ